MSWTPIGLPLTNLMALKARLERLRLVDQLAAAELHLRAAGLDASSMADARRALLARAPTPPAPMFPPPQPARADGSRPLRYLVVKETSHG